jgi:hypothetical protein
MKGIYRLKQLEDSIGCTAERLEELAFNLKDHVEELELPNGGNAPRSVWAPSRELRPVLKKIYLRFMLPRFESGPWSHGGIPGRSIVTNALHHRHSKHFLAVDIKRFFPSVHPKRIERTLREVFGVRANKVLKVLTALTTLNHQLAQGFSTSSFLANASVKVMDHRILRLAEKTGLIFTRYVDDIVLSGHSRIDDATEAKLVSIIEGEGFRVHPKSNPKKRRRGNSHEGFDITGIRVVQGKLKGTTKARGRVRQLIEEASWALSVDRLDLAKDHFRSLAGQLHHLRRVDLRFVRKTVAGFRKAEGEPARRFSELFFEQHAKLRRPKRIRERLRAKAKIS